MPHLPIGHGLGVSADGDRITALVNRAEAEAEAYARPAPDERPLGGYLALFGIYSVYAGALAAIVRWRRPELPERIDGRDLALLAVATHKLARVATKDAVTSPFRALFTRFSAPAGIGEVNEEARGDGLRHAVGELVTCPFCFGQWVATFFVFSYLVAPRLTRAVSSIFAVVAGSDLLQLAYAKLQQAVG